MLLDAIKPVALLLSILSLYGVFHTAFLLPALSLEDRLRASLLTLALAACIALLSGLLFQETDDPAHASSSLIATLPIQLFLWTTAAIVVLFAVSWYLETYVILRPTIRRY
jgi:hypothetical protein